MERGTGFPGGLCAAAQSLRSCLSSFLDWQCSSGCRAGPGDDLVSSPGRQRRECNERANVEPGWKVGLVFSAACAPLRSHFVPASVVFLIGNVPRAVGPVPEMTWSVRRADRGTNAMSTPTWNLEPGSWNVLALGGLLQVPLGYGLEGVAHAQEHLILSAGGDQLHGNRHAGI